MKSKKIIVTLLINTADNKKVEIGLQIDNTVFWLRRSIEFNQTQVVLPMMDKILKEKNIRIKDVDEVEVNMDEGSFTGQRIGVSIGNALSFSLGIPVKFKKFNDILKV